MIVSVLLLLMSSNIGEWLAFDETDNFDGSRRISAIQSAEDDALRDKPSLFMVCDEVGGVTMHLYQRKQEKAYGSYDLPVAIKFGNSGYVLDGSQTNMWKADDLNLYYAGKQMASFAAQTQKNAAVTFDVWTEKGKFSTTFLTEGTFEVYNYMAKNCPKAAEANSKLSPVDAIN